MILKNYKNKEQGNHRKISRTNEVASMPMIFQPINLSAHISYTLFLSHYIMRSIKIQRKIRIKCIFKSIDVLHTFRLLLYNNLKNTHLKKSFV